MAISFIKRKHDEAERFSDTERGGSINRLHRRHWHLIFGGYIGIAIVTVLILSLFVVSSVHMYVNQERNEAVSGSIELGRRITTAEDAVRNAAVNVPLYTSRNAALIGDVADRLIENGGSAIATLPSGQTQVLFGTPSALPRAALDRHVALSRQLAETSATATPARDQAIVGCYYVSLDGKFAAIFPPPSRDAQDHTLASAGDRSTFIAQTLTEFSPLMSGTAAPATLQHRTWTYTTASPFTGKTVMRVGSLLADHGKPIAIIFSEYDPSAIAIPLLRSGFDGQFLLTNAKGQLITFASHDGQPPSAPVQATAAELARTTKDQARHTWKNGDLYVALPFGGANWLLVYVLFQRDILPHVAPSAAIATLGAIALLVAIWVLLGAIRNRALLPLLEQAQYVFDSEKLSRTLIETAPIGLSLISVRDRSPLLSSPALTHLAERVGIDPRELTARLWADGETAAPANIRSEVLRRELTLRTPSLDEVHLSTIVARGRYHGADVIVGTFTDVTAQKTLEHQLIAAKEAADQANAAKTAFLASISHEIRTPLNAIIGNIEITKRTPGDTSRRQDRITIIEDAAQGLLTTLNDVLDFSKIEAGEMPLETIKFSILDVFDRSLAIFAPLALKKGIEIYGDFRLPIDAQAIGEPGRLGQVVNNLLSNAIKFTVHGKVTLRFRAKRRTTDDEPGGNTLVITVEDTGIGIPATHVPDIFKPFSQVDPSISRRFGGTGLGLALCHRIVALMGGSIAVESVPGQGSRFTVTVPLLDGGPMKSDPQFNGEHVVFISQDTEWHNIVVPRLASWNLSVHPFRSPAELASAALHDTSILILFGKKNVWPLSDENRLVETARHTLFCTEDGPVTPHRMGRGTELTCYSPRAWASVLAALLSDQVDRRDDTAPPPVEPLSKRALSVLIVEDNLANRHLLSEQLDVLGCDVTAAENGEEALVEFERRVFDVVLTDVQMPVMNGPDLARALRAGSSTLPIFAITASTMPAEHRVCIDAGIEKVLVKPVSLQDLYNALNEIAHGVGATLVSPQAKSRSTPASTPRRLKHILLESAGMSFARLRKAQQNHDAEAVLAELHALKGCFGFFPNVTMQRLHAHLESEVSKRGVAVLEDLLEDFEAAYWNAMTEI
ncbi:ATP-binding protein [Burkholderia semiarida]|uniref:histidine kinase n=1 Tax=Burkholderia semiarida TaxID=2843303 RepID=A0ABW7LBL9_9BURK